jgi:hypothetical protein
VVVKFLNPGNVISTLYSPGGKSVVNGVLPLALPLIVTLAPTGRESTFNAPVDAAGLPIDAGVLGFAAA